MVAVSVIVPARNAAATIGDTLEALADQDLEQPYEVIVVDNGSEDETARIAEAAKGPVSVIRQGRQRPGAARNRGAAAARAEIFAFTDADCIPASAWLREGLAALRNADLVQGAVRPVHVARGPFDRTVSVQREIGLYETANLFVRRSVFEGVGGFEDWLRTDIARPFGEDVWFGWRARRRGARVAFSRNALVQHAVFPRGPRDYIAERVRLAHFPALAARIPELRKTLFYHRWFLNRRTATFNGAVLGIVVAAVTSSPIPLLAAAPYGWLTAQTARPWGRGGPKVASVQVAADTVGFGALVWGSLRWRAPVL